MDKIAVFKKGKDIFIFNIKNFAEYLANIFKKIRDKILISFTKRFERNFV